MNLTSAGALTTAMLYPYWNEDPITAIATPMMRENVAFGFCQM